MVSHKLRNKISLFSLQPTQPLRTIKTPLQQLSRVLRLIKTSLFVLSRDLRNVPAPCRNSPDIYGEFLQSVCN